ncbi:MAG: GTPase HflX [Thermoguttaceae bacterium]|nr:GTPase HflX [Thermoguttaceae bacterium]
MSTVNNLYYSEESASQDRTVSTAKRPEKAVLAGVLQPRYSAEESDAFIEELAGLAAAAGVDVMSTLVQRRSTPHPATCLGQGKVDELKALVELHQADVVIFNNDLSPSQTRNLENELKVKVLDRTELILDIFAIRAQTYEAKLAVELAQLEYSMPRLKRMWTHLSRQTKGGVGLRGPGEKQLEVDRRLAQKRINDLKSALDDIHNRKKREVAARSSSNTISLVGYTNVGKSELINALTNSDVFVKNQLFATLDTRTRRWEIPSWGCVLVSDTVGFVRDLPHHLIASFRATLEEAVRADLLLHVADGSSPDVFSQIEAASEVLRDLGVDEKQTLLVINKADLFAPWDESGNETLAQSLEEKLQEGDISGIGRYRRLKQAFPNAIFISAGKKIGLDRLAEKVVEALSRNYANVELRFSSGDGKFLSFLSEHSAIESRQFNEDGTVSVVCKIAERFLNALPPNIQVTRRTGLEFSPKDIIELYQTTAIIDPKFNQEEEHE